MIEQVTLENFKIFKENTTVTLGKITLLTGPNGSGKSSVIQSFLLFRQSAEHDLYGHQLILKGSCVDLGNFGDIANVQRSNQPIRFQFKFTSSQPDNSLNFEAEYLFDRKEEISTYWLQELDIRSFNNQRLQSEKFIGENIGPLIGWLPESLKTSLSESLNDHLDFRKIHFISAYRRGPENFIPKTNLPFFPNTGPKGEFSENILAEHRSDLVHERLYRGNNARTLEQQTVEWLDYIFGGARLEIKGTDSDSSVLGLLMNTQNNDYRFKPTNIGLATIMYCLLSSPV